MAIKNKVISNPVNRQSIKFIQTAGDTGGSLLEMESVFAPHSLEPVPHYHPRQQETFTVLQGSIQVRIGGKVQVLHAGDRLHIPFGVVHSMWNGAGTEAVVNWKVQPALTTEYFLETVMGLATDGKVDKNGVPPLFQTALLATKYKKVFRLAKPPYFIQRIVFALLAPFARLAGYKPVYKRYLN